jgi:pyruvate, orthophosphate dikinase
MAHKCAAKCLRPIRTRVPCELYLFCLCLEVRSNPVSWGATTTVRLGDHVPAQSKRLYRFGSDATEIKLPKKLMRQLLGGKGAGLAEITSMGVDVPPGFTITTDVCKHYSSHNELPDGLIKEISTELAWLENALGRRLGDISNPLLVSVRSGAPVSMPGMMDTVLNVGLNRRSVRGLAEHCGSERFAFDCLRRLIQMFGSVVLNVPKAAFDEALQRAWSAQNVFEDSTLTTESLKSLVTEFEGIVAEYTGHPFPEDPHVQIEMAIRAVFDSWQNDRAQCYRKLNGISDAMGTAVTVQAMVFGNRGENSGTGVGFTRNPSTGVREMFGEFLTNAQGEDVVAGIRTPRPLAELAVTMPAVFNELKTVTERLERHYRDVQDFEFTFEDGRLYLLQTRSAKRSPLAVVQNAVDMADEGMITRREAIARVSPSSIGEILSPQLDMSSTHVELTTGTPASPGAVVGKIALSAASAVSMALSGEPIVLVTEETSADDIHGMAVSAGFLTARGGATSHAAVVARGMGKCCITGARYIHVDEKAETVRIGSETFRAGDWITLEGNTGRIFAGKLPLNGVNDTNSALDKLLLWAREESACLVLANADTPEDAQTAISHHAAGIGLCRTEHMFFSHGRLAYVRKMILATTAEDRVAALNKLLPIQQQDFEELFRLMSPLPVTIRLLDPPLHEFLPSLEEIDKEILAARSDENWQEAVDLDAMRRRTKSLAESNPMMGHRGCRLSLTYPEILEMQVRAILQAASNVIKEGFNPVPEIMVPLVSSEQEMQVLAEMIHKTASGVQTASGMTISYKVGTMIELPRAALVADQIVKHVSFLSFGTNDLTQMTYGFSRDDSRTYLDHYLERGILKADPFITIDQEGVGELIRTAIERVRKVNPRVKIGVCGEHGGDPESIRFFCSIGVDYVSCSPARIPVAQLATAQASIQQQSLGNLLSNIGTTRYAREVETA